MAKKLNTKTPTVYLDGKVVDFNSVEILPPNENEGLRIKLVLRNGETISDSGVRIHVEFMAP